MKQRKVGKGMAIFTSLTLSACLLGAMPAVANAETDESGTENTVCDAAEQALVQAAIDGYFASERCVLGAESDYTFGNAYAVYGISNLKRMDNFYQTYVFQNGALIGKLDVYGDAVTYQALDEYDAQAIQAAMQAPDFMICSGTNYWVNAQLRYDLIYANGMVNDLTENEMLGDYSALNIQKYISGTISQNGYNCIATDAQRQCIEKNILACDKSQTTPLADGYLSYSYCVVSATDMEPVPESAYVTFLIVQNQAVGYFRCDAAENADCTYVPMQDNVFVDAMYSDRGYQILSGETCKIAGESHRLLLYFDGVLTDLETGETIYTGDWDDLQMEADSTTLCGDMNQDNSVNLLDEVLLQKAANGTVVLDKTQAIAADCNADDEIDGGDAATLMEFLLHQVDALPYASGADPS